MGSEDDGGMEVKHEPAREPMEREEKGIRMERLHSGRAGLLDEDEYKKRGNGIAGVKAAV